MKRISETQVEFDVIVKSCNVIQTCEDDADKVEMYIHYFDRESELNLVLRGRYSNEFLKYLDKVSREMRVIKLVLTVKDKNYDVKNNVIE